MPASVTEDLATHLNAKQGRNWKHLAGLMGYSSPFTQNLELEPREATQRLLQEWMQKSGSTVFQLYCLLQKLGRDDAVNVLLPFLKTPKTRGEVDVWWTILNMFLSMFLSYKILFVSIIVFFMSSFPTWDQLVNVWHIINCILTYVTGVLQFLYFLFS